MSEANSSSTSSSSSSSSSQRTRDIISLDEKEQELIDQVLKRSLIDQRKKSNFKGPQGNCRGEAISILSSDEEDNHESDTMTNDDCAMKRPMKRIKRSKSDPDFSLRNEEDDDDCVVILDVNEAKASGMVNIGTTVDLMDDDDGDEVAVVGEKNTMKLPHARQDCTDCRFVLDVLHNPCKENSELNQKFCDLCYCYICNKPASQCTSWSSTEKPDDIHSNHCLASDKGIHSGKWKRMRELVKEGKSTTLLGSFSPSCPYRTEESESSDTQHEDQGMTVSDEDEDDYYSYLYHNKNEVTDYTDYKQFDKNRRTYDKAKYGPFDPNDARVRRDKLLTKCRKCGWYNYFKHNNFTAVESYTVYEEDRHGVRRPIRKSKKVINDTGVIDWCKSCGRVCSDKDFGKTQSEPYTPEKGDIKLGTKSIPFRIKARDPRKITPFDKNWEKHGTSWVYNETEMEEDFFHHRIGKHPNLRMILGAIPVLAEEKIPDEGVANYKVDYYASSFRSGTTKRQVLASETEALLFDGQNDRILFEELNQFTDKDSLAYSLEAHWDKESKRGAIDVTLFLGKNAKSMPTCSSRKENNKYLFSRVLGSFYGIFPFKLKDLARGLEAKEVSELRRKQIASDIPSFGERNISEYEEVFQSNEYKEALEKYNSEAKLERDKNSFVSSLDKDDCGGICENETTFAGTLRKFFRESIIQDIRSSAADDWLLAVTEIGRKQGFSSCHRKLCETTGWQRADFGLGMSFRPTYGFRSYVKEEEQEFLFLNLAEKLKSINARLSTLDGVLRQLENLGHKTADQTDGLNIELFGFQRQAVKWALERETQGLEGSLWTEVPESPQLYTGENNYAPIELYYSPVLDLFKEGRPSIVRGGIIAEQMGLGKTVISLALILQNPAPALPLSGTLLESYKDPSTQWGFPKTYEPFQPAKRGSIFSKGTLVVCNVSLVGQWISEAKSKLKDPGLVYSYHGHGRKRDPNILAANAIVVTTYAILASDDTYHRKKSEDPDYCTPCEQVWWWRIICDESHSIKDGNTKNSAALSNLRAVNKWCVTGTPMNTSLLDLRNQMKFIGLTNVEKMFSLFRKTMTSHFPRNGRSSYHSPKELWGDLLFLLRNIMIRHSIKQKELPSRRDLMSLPPKEEKAIIIEFSEEERKEYEKLEVSALQYYIGIKRTSGRGKISKHYLKLNSGLNLLRIACSGGDVKEQKVQQVKNMKPDNAYHLPVDHDLECVICLSVHVNPMATQCKPIPHVFCQECIETVLSGRQQVSCPSCRQTVKKKSLRPALLPSELSDDVDESENESEGIEEEKLEGKKESLEANLDSGEPEMKNKDQTNPNPAPDELAQNKDEKGKSKKKKDRVLSDIPFKSKFNHLLKELEKIRDNEPGSKSLVFSQFSSTLQWLKQELPKHGFKFRTLSGDMPMSKRAKALRDFQSDPPTTIFLLSMRSAAAGINLTQANRVFLMEPALNPALEAQAIGRVYRLGQKKPVQVVKFVMKDSFETRLLKLHEQKYAGKAAQEDNSDEKDETSKKESSSSKRKSTNSVVGHMFRDKAELLESEFDLLYNEKTSSTEDGSTED